MPGLPGAAVASRNCRFDLFASRLMTGHPFRRPAPPATCTSAARAPRCFRYLYAKRLGGKFLLRIEDTDRERSTQAAVDAIFEGMAWLGLKSGDFADRSTRPSASTATTDVIQQMLAAGTAYHCYCARAEELDALRAEQQARKEKPRYDGRWRPEPGKTCRRRRQAMQPVVRFRNPPEGQVVIDDLIKGRRSCSTTRNSDDLIIARGDGVPTYNFCVVVDDMDMGITHVIRGDDHVNNTPRQINILKALGVDAAGVCACVDDSRQPTAPSCPSATARSA